MRMVWLAIKSTAVLLLCAASAIFAYLLIVSPVFERGESYEFYLGASSSSLSVQSQNPVLDKILLGATQGESVRYDGDRAQELLQKYRAQTLFSEQVGDTLNYYCYSPLLGEGVRLNGYTVNLHVAVNGVQTAAGTPLIFGGF